MAMDSFESILLHFIISQNASLSTTLLTKTNVQNYYSAAVHSINTT